MQRNKIIDIIEHPDFVDFCEQNKNRQASEVALEYSGKTDFDLQTGLQLLRLYQKGRRKLPTWIDNRCAITPRSYEQCTSETISCYRSGLFTGDLAIDLTGGLGVDSYYLAQRFKRVISVEQDLELSEMQAYNNTKLGAHNIQVRNMTFDAALTSLDLNPDLIFIDPDRRTAGKRVFRLDDCSPNILPHLNTLIKSTKRLVLKLSPLADLSYIEAIIPFSVQIAVLSEKNEVKEVLKIIGKRIFPGKYSAIDITDNVLTYTSDAFKKPTSGTDLMSYLFEPFSALIKSGLADSYASEHNLLKLGQSTFLYTTDKIHTGLDFGKKFKLIDEVPVRWNKLKQYLKERECKAIMISKRDFPESVNTIRKRIGLPDGGNLHLYFFTDWDKKKRCAVVQRLE